MRHLMSPIKSSLKLIVKSLVSKKETVVRRWWEVKEENLLSD